MNKDFENRKVKFYVLERKNIKVTKIDFDKNNNRDDFDLSFDLWKNLSNKACDDCGFLDREKPKVPFSYNDIDVERLSYKKKRLSDVKNNIKKIYSNKSINSINIAKGSEMYEQHKNPYKSSQHKLDHDSASANDDLVIKFKVNDDKPYSSKSSTKNQVIKKK